MSDLTAEEIKAMIANGEREDRSLEFKEQLPGPTDSEKLEFLCDVAALANGGGGRLVYGIKEKRDANGQATGVAEAAPGVDDANLGKIQLGLEQALQRGIEPRIPGYRFYSIVRLGENPLVVLDVPRSWLAPHMVCRDEKQLFYSRHGSGKYRLDAREIRAAFLASEGVESKMRRFRDERLGRIIADETPVPLLLGPRLVLHLLPVSAFGDFGVLSPQQIVAAAAEFRLGDYSSDRRPNLDGVLFLRPATSTGHRGYVQVFRTGVVESVLADLKPEVVVGVGCLRAKTIEDKVVLPLISRQLQGLRKVGVQPPVVFTGALLGASGFHLFLPGEFEEALEAAIDRDVALFPEELLEVLPPDASGPVRRLFDSFCMAGGLLRES